MAAQKTAKFWRDFGQLHDLSTNISGKKQEIDEIVKRCRKLRSLPYTTCVFKLVNFGPQMGKIGPEF